MLENDVKAKGARRIAGDKSRCE